MYKDVNFSDVSKEFIEQLQKGAFLTVKSGDRINTMTIAWGAIGFMWSKPILTVMVRKSRYTYDIIEKAQGFTVSLPLKGQLKEALGFCGTKSGRDVDKIKECNLSLREGKYIDAPIIDDCDMHVECKIVYKQPMDGRLLSDEIKGKAYANGDYHDIYYGTIEGVYIKE